jgi:hypothetical protein
VRGYVHVSERPVVRRLALVAALAAVATSLLVPGAAHADSGSRPDALRLTGPQIRGTLTWTVVVQTRRTETDDYGMDNLATSKTTDTGVLHVVLGRFASPRPIYVAANNGSTYDARIDTEWLSIRRHSGETSCTTTGSGTATGGGKFAPWNSKAHSPVLNPALLPDSRGPGRSTKALALEVRMTADGTATWSQSGSGETPCETSGPNTDAFGLVPIWGHDNVDERRFQCLPNGVRPDDAPSYTALVGAWHIATKSFVFDCTKTLTIPDGTAQMTINGTLRYG